MKKTSLEIPNEGYMLAYRYLLCASSMQACTLLGWLLMSGECTLYFDPEQVK